MSSCDTVSHDHQSLTAPVSDAPPTPSSHCAPRAPLRIDTPPHSPHFRNDRTTRLAVYELFPTPTLAHRKRTTTRKAHTIGTRLRILWRQENAAERK